MNDSKNAEFIEGLLASDDIHSSVIQLFKYICKLCSYGEELEKLSVPQKVFYFNQELEQEVCNGGFSQFFYNSTGDFAHETLISLLQIGAKKTANLLQLAINHFPGGIVPKNRETRIEIIWEIDGNASEKWHELDLKFFVYEEDLNLLNIEYVKKNKQYF